MHVFERYRELQGTGILGAGLSLAAVSVAARAVHDPAGPLPANGTLQLVPSGDRQYCCLPAAGENRVAGQGPPAGFDFCAADAGHRPARRTRLGQEIYVPLHIGPNTLLNVDTPLYQGGVVPPTVEARREASWDRSVT
jgi:hypothetical protein